MANEEEKPSILNELNLASAIRRALSRSLPSALVGALLIVVFVTLFLVGLSASIIQIAQSNWVAAVVDLILIAAGISLVGIYFVRILDEAPSKRMLTTELNRLMKELELTRQNLAMAQDMIQTERQRRAESREKLIDNFIGYLGNYIEEFDEYAELAQLYAQNRALASDDLRTTHVQLLPDEKFVVWFPIGEQQGATPDLSYYLYEPAPDPNLAPSPLGIASLRLIQLDRSMALVKFYETAEATRFWDQTRIDLQNRNSIPLGLKAQPLIPMFQSSSLETLQSIRRLLLHIRQVAKTDLHNQLNETVSNSTEVN